jgi:hypothetical protein
MRIEIDHIAVITDTPEEHLKALQAATGLPELWPFTTSETIQSGALWEGSTGIEFTRLEGAQNRPPRIGGIAFKAHAGPWEMAQALRVLDLPHIPPTTTGPFGEATFFWTTVMVGGLLDGEARTIWLGKRFGGAGWFARWMSGMGKRLSRTPKGQAQLNSVLREHMTFFVDYHDTNRVAEQTGLARNAFQAVFDKGPLSRPVIAIGQQFDGLKAENWSRLLGQKIAPNGTYSAGAVDLQFVEAARNRILSMKLGVPVVKDKLPEELAKLISGPACSESHIA